MSREHPDGGTKQPAPDDAEVVIDQLRALLTNLPEAERRDEVFSSVVEALRAGGASDSMAGASARIGDDKPWRPSAGDGDGWFGGGQTDLDRRFEAELDRLIADSPSDERLLDRLAIAATDSGGSLAGEPSALADMPARFSPSRPNPGRALMPMPGNHVRDWISLYALSLIERFGNSGEVIEDDFAYNFTLLMEALYSFLMFSEAPGVGVGAHRKGEILSSWAMLPKSPDWLKREETVADRQKRRRRFISLTIGSSRASVGSPLFTWRLIEARRLGSDATLAPSATGRELLTRIEGLGPRMPHQAAHADAFVSALEASSDAKGDLSGLLLALWNIESDSRTAHRDWRTEGASLFDAFFPMRPSKRSSRLAGESSSSAAPLESQESRPRKSARGNILFHAYTSRCREWGLVATDGDRAYNAPPELTELGRSVLGRLAGIQLDADEGFPDSDTFETRAMAARAKILNDA